MHSPLSPAAEPSALPESSWVLPESSSVTAESESPLEDPLLEEVPLEEPLLDIAPPESPRPLEAPSGAAPSLDAMGFKVPDDVVVHAGTRGAVTSAKRQMRTDRAFMFGTKQSRCHVQVRRKCLTMLEECVALRRTGDRARVTSRGARSARTRTSSTASPFPSAPLAAAAG
jgi:hypothetical protein